jgi:DNA-binding beta-propeller fold protein YncE
MTVKISRPARRALVVLATGLVLPLAGFGFSGSAQATAPVKLVVTAHYGTKVNETTGSDTCTAASGNECQPGVEGSAPGEFAHATAIAAAPNGNFYVGDLLNHRVQELTSTGQFVLMFGKDVNATTGGDVCTAKEVAEAGVKCQAGEAGHEAGALISPQGLAVDPGSGNVYVAEAGSDSLPENDRVDEFTENGAFVLMLGNEVNETTGANLCTEKEILEAGVKCKGATPTATGAATGAPGTFALTVQASIAVSPADHRLYVGDEHRVQEFNANGAFEGEIPLTGLASTPFSRVSGLTIDGAGHVYLTYLQRGTPFPVGGDVLRVFSPSGLEERSFDISRDTPESFFRVSGISIDAAGRLAVAAFENQGAGELGELYDAASGHLITEFSVNQTNAIAFGPAGEMFAAGGTNGEVTAYGTEPVAELSSQPGACAAGSDLESDATFDCALKGLVNPEGVSQTEAWFQWGLQPGLGESTPHQPVADGAQPVAVEGLVKSLPPHTSVFARVSADDANVRSPELLTSTTQTLTVPLAPPRVLAAPATEFVSASTAVLRGSLNPENAPTSFWFEYCPAAQAASVAECAAPTTTAAQESARYGPVGVTQEARGLQPATAYRVRMAADNRQTIAGEPEGALVPGTESEFTSAPGAVPTATTGAAMEIGAASAVIQGSVDPGGAPATYVFELAQASQPTLVVVAKGSAGSGTQNEGESLLLTGLQPATQYVYRIAVPGQAAGQTATFTTLPVPLLSTPQALAQLTVPPFAFPKAGVARAETSEQKSKAALKTCKKRAKKARCERQAKRKDQQKPKPKRKAGS